MKAIVFLLSFLTLWKPSKVVSLSLSNRNKRPLSQRRHDPLCIERDLVQKGHVQILGSDDAGTGAIAGPLVTVTCSLLVHPEACTPIESLRGDGKQLSASERALIYQEVCRRPDTYAWTLAIRSNQQIDEMGGVQRALSSCFHESIESMTKLLLEKSDNPVNPNQLYSIVDGSRSPPGLSVVSRPWVKADSIVYTVALASVLARVIRDDLMKQEAQLIPGQYGFDEHGGYPTERHLLALHQFGPSSLHRQSCKPVSDRRLPMPRNDFIRCVMIPISTLLTTVSRVDRTESMTVDPKTGVRLPDAGEIETAIPSDWTVVDNPFAEADTMFNRLDSSRDSLFYTEPRFVEHVDMQAVQIMTDYISNVAIRPETQAVLDLCSSWTSHIAEGRRLKRLAGLGMNAEELKANDALTEWVVQDLNEDPILPFQDESFDAVLCQLSIDYLTRPLIVCREIGRVLKPGGTVHILFSNRLFLSKAVGLWTGADDIDHAFYVASYLYFCGGQFGRIQAHDLSTRKGRDHHVVGDPLYVVTALKQPS